MPRICSLAVLCLALSACSTRITFTARAVESLPQVVEPSNGLTSGRSIASESQLRGLFRQECFMPGADNYCPAGVDVSGGSSSAFKFTSTSLLGLIYHAELYSGGHRTACTGRSASLTTANLLPVTAGGDPARYVLDTLPLHTCIDVMHDSALPRPQAHSVAPDYQATLTLDSHVPDGPGTTRTAVWQVYTGFDQDQTPRFLAFNYAAFDSFGSRALLLVNLETHHFAIKYLTAPPPGATRYRFVTAIGVGGVDRGTGSAHPGYYFASFSNETDPANPDSLACVDNATQLIEVDDTECRAAGVPVAWSSADPVAAWLGMSSDEQARLAPFLAKFTSPAPLADAETPSSAAEGDTNFPARFE